MLRVHKALTRSARIGLAVLALSLPASAETLTQALVSAYNHSGLLDQNRALLRAADEDVAQSVAALRPVIGWSAEVSRAFGTTRSTSTGGRTIGFVNNEATIGLAAEMTLFDNGATRLAGEAAKEAVLATRQQLIAVEQSVLLRAVSAFMEVRRATETAAAIDADTLGAKPHCRLNGALHGTAERDTALKLLCDRLRNQRGVDLRLTHFNDVEVRFGLRHRGQLLAKLLDVGALLADDQARPRGVDRHPALLVRTLDHDLGDGSLLQLLLKIFADLQILVQQLSVLAGICEPARIPGPVDAESQADRIDFLAHQAASAFSSTSRTTIVRCENGFSMRDARPRPRV